MPDLELVEEPGTEASEVFGDRLPLVRRYADWLSGAGIERGLLGPRERSRLWSRHLLNCAYLTELIPPGSRVIDVGSGAGLPGMVLALRRPDLQVVLVEPLLRRSRFLAEVVDDLGLTGSVEVVRARAEDVAGAVAGDVVTARAVAPLDRLATWCLPLVVPGGQLLALKGSSADEEAEAARPSLERAGVVGVEVVRVGPATDPTRVVRIMVGDQVRHAAGPPRAGKGQADRSRKDRPAGARRSDRSGR